MHIVFFRILKLFFITFYCIFNLDFFVFFCHLLNTLQWRGMVHGLQFYYVCYEEMNFVMKKNHRYIFRYVHVHRYTYVMFQNLSGEVPVSPFWCRHLSGSLSKSSPLSKMVKFGRK